MLDRLLLNKAQFIVEGELSPIIVQFNPEQYVLSESANYSSNEEPVKGDAPKESNGVLEKVKPESQFRTKSTPRISLSFYFDTSDFVSDMGITTKFTSDVSKVTKKFHNMLKAKEDTKRPPNVEFVWGSISFKGIVTQVSTSFTKFTPTGMPVQAKVDLSMEELPPPSAVKVMSVTVPGS